MIKHRTRYWKFIGITTIGICLVAGSLWYLMVIYKNSTNTESLPDDADTIVTAAGVTEIGIKPVTFAVDFLEDTSLYVEEVYLADGDTVSVGEPYIKFTDESIQKARAELEQAVQNAQLAYRSREIASGEDKIQAKYTYDTTVLEAEFAPQVYQDTLTNLQMQLLKAEKAFEEAQNTYNAYYLAVANNTFYEDYQIEKLKKAYDDAYDLFASRRDYWEVTQEELNALSDREYWKEMQEEHNALSDKGYWQAAQKELATQYDDNMILSGQRDRHWIVKTVALLKEELTKAQDRYEQAKQDYQQEIEGAELKLQKLLNQSEQATQNLIDAQLACQKGSLHAKTVFELAVAKGQVAESNYNVFLSDLANELTHLKTTMDEAEENKMLFENLVGDGYLYTEQAGTVLMVQAEQGQVLEGGSQILAYADDKELSVSVTVPGTDAARLFEGERASVSVEGCGSLDGVVEAISPITASGRKTSAYSMVQISLNGDVSMVLPDQAATVVFGGGAQGDIVQCSVDGNGAAGRGTVSQMYTYDFLAGVDEKHAESLEVAVVYAESGQHIEEGDRVCEVTQESIENVRKALTDIQSEAGSALVRAQTDYQINVLEAGLNHNEAVIGRTLAQTEYDNTIAGLNSGLAAKILETEQLLTDIYELQTTLTDDTRQQQRSDITSAYEQAKKQVEKAREGYVTSQVEAAENFQAAKDSYERFFARLEASNQQIADKIEKVYALQEEIQQSQLLMEKALLAAEQTRTSARTEGEIAYAKYDSTLKKHESAVNKAQSDLEQATRRLEDFNQFVGNGTIYASGNGLVTKVGYRKGDLIDNVQKLIFFVPDTAADFSAETVGKEDTQ